MRFEEKAFDRVGERIYAGEHKSGLRVYAMPKQGYSKSYALFATKYGSINRSFAPAGQQDIMTVPDGIAHFLEHKLFEEKQGNVFDRFARYGASANAFTSFAMTAYLFSCTNSFYENLDILLNFVSAPYFTDENVEKEQGIIGQEIRMYLDSPGWRVFFNCLEALYVNHPVKIDIAGTEQSIAQINKGLLYECYNTFYHPSNMILFAVGDVHPDRVGELVERVITAAPKEGSITESFPEEPSGISKAYIEQELSVSIPLFMLGFKDTPPGENLLKREVASELVLELVMGKSSPLYSELYKKGLINDSFSFEYQLEKSFALSSVSGESSDPAAVRDSVCAEIERLSRGGLDRNAFERAKRRKYGSFIKMLNKVEGVANAYVGGLMRGYELMEYPNVVSSITLSQTERRMREMLDPEKMALSVIKNERKAINES